MVTRQDLDAYGTFNLWDALRGVPGVDVSTTRAADGIVSIRGLTKENNNRTLILLNGRRALDGFVESLNWESLPVTLDEIDRIEIVEGPASALYGGNAISGVINIITRQPGQAEGLSVSLTGGSRETGRASALYGHTAGGLEVTASGEFSTSNQFEASHRSANQVVRGRTQIRYDPGDGRVLSFSAGGSDLRTQVSQGGLGSTYEDGSRGFVRADYIQGNHRLRASWMGGSTLLESFGTPSESRLDYGTLELLVQSPPAVGHRARRRCRDPSGRPRCGHRRRDARCLVPVRRAPPQLALRCEPVVERPAGPPPARRDRIFSTGDGGDRGRRA